MATTLTERGEHPQRRRPSAGVRRNRRLVAGGAIVAVAVVATIVTVMSRGGGEERLDDAGGRSATTTSPVGGRRGNGRAVTLAFGGDVHFEGQIRQRLRTAPTAVLAGVAPLLRSADIAIVNLETAVTTRGTKALGKQYAFRAPPAAFDALRSGGVDVASMANNHGMDYGQVGLEDSLDAAGSAGFPVVGIGRNAAEAYQPWVKEVGGQRIAVIGATQVLDDELISTWTATDSQPGLASAKQVDRLTAAVRAARAQADTVVVVLHWGTEGQTCPNEAQPVLARALAEAGADVIVGGHAHRLQGAGRLGGSFVAYGLGNFAFYADRGPGTETGVLTVTVTGRDVDAYRWAPAQLVGQLPRPLKGTAADQALRAWESLRGCTGLTK